MRKAIIFDFDGVIHDTFEFHRGKVGEFAGTSISKQDFQDIHNGNFYEHKNDKLDNVDWIAYRDFTHEGFKTFQIDEKMKEMLLALNDSHELFIISSGGEKNIGVFVKNNGLENIFKEVLGGETHSSKVEKFNSIFKKYNLSNEDVIFITDTLGDILEANEMNIKTIAVDFGYHPRETLEKGKPFKIVSSVGELSETIKNL